jgi:hypothetical protein
MRVIDQIANLILEDPYITASGIAKKLGYAEEKTVYYWINKHHYHGLVAFKRAVLSGQFRPASRAVRESPSRYGRIPIVDRFSPQGQPIYSGETVSLTVPKETQFVWRYPGPALLHIIPQDLLAFVPFQPPLRNPWVAGLHNHQMVLRLMVARSPDLLAVHAESFRPDPDFQPLYQIISLIRYF